MLMLHYMSVGAVLTFWLIWPIFFARICLPFFCSKSIYKTHLTKNVSSKSTMLTVILKYLADMRLNFS